MAKTQGQLEERSPGHWRIRVFLGRDAEGKRRYLSATVEGIKEDAEKKLRALLEQKDQGRLARPTRRPLAAFLDEWLDVAVKPRVRPKTLAFYRAEVALIKLELGMIRLDRLSVLDVHAW